MATAGYDPSYGARPLNRLPQREVETALGRKLPTGGTWTHDYPIRCYQAREFGLSANSNLPQQVLELMQLFPQPVRRSPAVEYLPTPRSVPKERREAGRERATRPQPQEA